MSMQSFTLFVLMLTLLQHYYNFVNACRCPFKLPQEKFCDADFVIKAQVDDVIYKYAEDRSMDISQKYIKKTLIKFEYKVNIMKVFKKSNKFMKASKEYVMSPGTYPGCGKKLKKNKQYLLTGTVINKELWIDGCGWNVPYKPINIDIKRRIMNVYKKHCDCQISRCQGATCLPEFAKDQCVMQIDAWTCFKKYGICAKSRNQKKRKLNGAPSCSWNNQIRLGKCLKKLGQHIIKPKKKTKKNKKQKQKTKQNENRNKNSPILR